MSAHKLGVIAGLSPTEIFTAVEMPQASTESERTIKTTGTKLQADLDDTSSNPKIEKPVYNQQITLAGASQTLDLTALPVAAMPPAATRTVDMTGKRLIACFFHAAAANDSGGMTLKAAAANGYDLFGNGKEYLILPGEVVCAFFYQQPSARDPVAGADKDIDIAGTIGDVIDVVLAFGT